MTQASDNSDEGDRRIPTPAELPRDESSDSIDSTTKSEANVRFAEMVAEMVVSRYSGPLPPASEIKVWKEVLPDAPDRIVKMAEKQQDHRIAIESIVVRGDNTRANWGLFLGFIVAIAFLAGGVYLIATGHSWEGLAFGGAPLVGLVGTFVYVGRQRGEERRDKSAEMQGPPDDSGSYGEARGRLSARRRRAEAMNHGANRTQP